MWLTACTVSTSVVVTPQQVAGQILARPTQAATIARRATTAIFTPASTASAMSLAEAPTRSVDNALISRQSDIRIVIVLNNMTPTTTPGSQVHNQLQSVSLNITSHARTIFERGQQLGNRANVFSKVGDSLTVATYVLYPIGWGSHTLYDYEYLAPVIQYFSAATARASNSFANISLSADNGWTTQSVFDPTLANPELCLEGEPPLLCEYRIVRPAVALILLGTNDVAELSLEAFRGNLRNIIEISIHKGIIPVISTLPNRRGYEQQVLAFNQAIRTLAYEFGVPLWDYGGVMALLPNGGLSEDGVHPSWPPGDFSAAADFSDQNLQYGYTTRNLSALQMLDAIWKSVMLIQ